MGSVGTVDVQAWITHTLSYLCLTLGLVLVLKYLLGTNNVRGNIPPCPVRPYPILGHLPYLKTGIREQMRKWTETTGDIFSLYFGSRLVIILGSYDAVHEAFVKHAETMSDRSPSMSLSGTRNENTGILTSSGHVWKEQRTVALQILRAFGMGKNILAEKVSEEVSTYLDALSQLSGRPSDVRTLTNTAVSNVICSIIVGKRFEYDDAYFVEFLNILNEQVVLGASTSLASTFKWLKYLPGDLFNAKKRIQNFNQIRTLFCYHYIKKTEDQYDENNTDNFISAYLLEMNKMEQHGKDTTLNRENLARVLNNLFIAGSETTSTTILWFLVYMLHFPDIQDKVFREIKETIGTERAPTMHDRLSLNYTNAAIFETQRLASIVPLGVPHYTREDTVIKDYTIPAGTNVMSNLDAVLLDEAIWKDPTKFKPERFLDAHGKLSQPEQFTPYSIGRRVCLGESLARMELYLFLSSLVQRFELMPAVPGQLPARRATNGVTSPPEKFQIRFVDRRAS